MAYRNLQEFLQRLESAGQLQRIGVEVDAELEITEIADRQVKRSGPALLMEKVRGSAFPLLINAFASTQRMAWALGVDDCDEIAGRIRKILTARPPEGLIDKIKGLGQLVELSQYAPKSVTSGACQEVVLTGQDASLDVLPILKCWPGDGGRFVTLGAVFTRSRKTGHQNAGM